MNLNKQIKIIIPAAGYGTRMGGTPAKELLKHPKSQNNFLQEAMSRHKTLSYQMLPAHFHVISRVDKTALNDFVLNLKNENMDDNLTLQTIAPSKEWPDSVRQSAPYWNEWNLLLLPDADYAPLITTPLLKCLMDDQSVDLYFFTFAPENPAEWGVIKCVGGQFFIADKPKETRGPTHQSGQISAWGLILFRKSIGQELFSTILESNQDRLWKPLSIPAYKIKCVSIQSFTDLTRGAGEKNS